MRLPFEDTEENPRDTVFTKKTLQSSTDFSLSLLSILTNLHYCLIVVNPLTHHILYHDQDALEMYQYSTEEIASLPFYALFESPWDKVTRLLTIKKNQNEKHFQTKLRRKDGNPFDADVFVIPFRFNGEIVDVLFMRNLTEDKKKENQLIESASRHKALFTNMSYPYACLKIQKDENKQIEYCSISEVNLEFEKMISCKEADIIGKPILEILPSLSQLTSPWKEILDKIMIDHEKVSFELVMESFHRNYLVTMYPVSNTQFASIFEDITSQKRLNRLRNAFINTLTHEIRTPLTAIKAGMEIWMKNPEAPLVKQENLPNMIHNNVLRLITLINQVVDYQKIDNQSFDEFYTQQSINKMIVEIVSNMQQIFEEKNIQLQLDLDDAIQKSWYYKDKISQVLINLINNAVKFTNYGQVVITSSLKRNLIEIKISDTGIGIEQETQKKLFDTFYQVTPSAKDGTSMGLPLSRKIVERHGGTIWVESKPFQGSSFFFTIPYETQGKKP